ncbi:merozoite surface protein 10 putative [Plasmodium cynomolgi strain B]|uniref:Merozoite surface protein 10 putative n=1 Tax=Plasmodium cynomolgi (strain B) TaxID=1120755 RepID=K6UDX3_PLACD|nr:merozoite surface protein 10 putative [Plasmodium cynomolgi strain B]GAB67351.1 merozoite surface protein 10 putative [Plasmodium cynomolgi strain B]
MKCAKWNKSLTFTIFLLLYVNNAVNANRNELKGTDGVDVPNQKDITNDYNIFERISSEGQSASSKRASGKRASVKSASSNDDSHISQSDAQHAEEGSDAKQGNTFLDEKNSVKNVETYFIQEGQDKANHTELHMEKEGKAVGHVQKNANLRSTSYVSSQGAVNQAYNFAQENPPPLGKNGAYIEQVTRAQDDVNTTGNDGGSRSGEEGPTDGGDGKDGVSSGKPGETISSTPESTSGESSKENQEKRDKEKETEDKSNLEDSKSNEKTDQENGKTTAEKPNSHKKIKNTLLKEGRELKETTSMIDNAVYNMEQFILKTKFYTTAIRNFVHFKVNHICEYSKCGSNARCYIVEKDKEECRCMANYMPDESVDYFKCIPKTEKDCSKDNGNCDVNAECSIDKNKNIKCQCKYSYIGDGIFCVIGSQEKQSLCLLLVLLICVLHKFLF